MYLENLIQVGARREFLNPVSREHQIKKVVVDTYLNIVFHVEGEAITTHLLELLLAKEIHEEVIKQMVQNKSKLKQPFTSHLFNKAHKIYT